MKKTTGFYPRVQVDTARCSAVGQAGGVLLIETIRTSGLDAGCRRRWRRGASRSRCMTRQDRAAIWRCRWRWAGTAWPISRCCGPSRACSAGSPPTRRCRGWSTRSPLTPTSALAAIEAARAAARARVWALAGDHAPDHGSDARAR